MMQIFILFLGVLLLYFSLPNTMLHLSFLAWVAFIPLIYLNHKFSSKRVFLINYLFFFVFFMALLHLDFWVETLRFYCFWVNGTLILFYLAFPLFFALTFTLAYRISTSLPVVWKPFIWASMWVLMEYGMETIPFLFPLPLYLSQYNVPIVLQSASVLGSLWISFLIIFTNTSLFFTIQESLKKHKLNHQAKYLLISLVILHSLNLGYGIYKLNFSPLDRLEDKPVTLVLVQPNVSWEESVFSMSADYFLRTVLNTQTKISELARNEAQPDIIIWPELSVYRYGIQDEKIKNKLLTLLPTQQTSLLFGTLWWDLNKKSRFNVATLLNSDGKTQIYKKGFLVPIFETSQYEKAADVALLESDKLKIGTMLCFESLFSGTAATLTKKGGEALMLLANGAWFGHTNWSYLHAAAIVFRAAETERYSISLNNNGPSFVISPRGHILLSLPAFKTAYAVTNIYPIKNQTLYTQYGDWFPLLCCLFVLIVSVRVFIEKIRQGGK